MNAYKNILKALNESTNKFKVGDRVRVKEEFADSEDDAAWTYKIIELRGDRVLVEPEEQENSSMTIVPNHVFKNEWIEKIED